MTRRLDMVRRYSYGPAGCSIGMSPGTAALMALGAAVGAVRGTVREPIEG